MFSISSFEIINAVFVDPWIYSIAASSTDIHADNPNGIKTLLAIGVSTFFINGKPTLINGLKKLRNPLSRVIIFLVVPFNKIPLFFKDLITFYHF